MEQKIENHFCKKHNRIRELVNLDTREVECPECYNKKNTYVHIRDFIDAQKISDLISQAQEAVEKIIKINNDYFFQIKTLNETIDDFYNKENDLVENIETNFCDMSSITKAKKLLKDLHHKQKKGINFFLTFSSKISQLGELKSTLEKEITKPVDAINITTILEISNKINQYDSKEITSKHEEIKNQYQIDSTAVQSILVEIEKSYLGMKTLLSKENASQIMEKGLVTIFKENEDYKVKVAKLQKDLEQKEVTLKGEKETELKELGEAHKKVLDDLNKKYLAKEEELKKANENHSSELTNLKSAQNEAKNKELKELGEAHKKALDDLNKKYLAKEEELKKANENHSSELTNLKTAQNEAKNKELKELSETHKKALDDLNKKYLAKEEELKKANENHSSELTNLKSAQNKELKELGEAHKKVLDDLNKKYIAKEEELKKTNENHSSELTNLKSAQNEAKNKELKELGETHKKALDDLNKKYLAKEEELKKTKEDHIAENAKKDKTYNEAKEEEKKKNDKALLDKAKQIDELNKSLVEKNNALTILQKSKQELDQKVINLENELKKQIESKKSTEQKKEDKKEIKKEEVKKEIKQEAKKEEKKKQ